MHARRARRGPQGAQGAHVDVTVHVHVACRHALHCFDFWPAAVTSKTSNSYRDSEQNHDGSLFTDNPPNAPPPRSSRRLAARCSAIATQLARAQGVMMNSQTVPSINDQRHTCVSVHTALPASCARAAGLPWPVPLRCAIRPLPRSKTVRRRTGCSVRAAEHSSCADGRAWRPHKSWTTNRRLILIGPTSPGPPRARLRCMAGNGMRGAVRGAPGH